MILTLWLAAVSAAADSDGRAGIESTTVAGKQRTVTTTLETRTVVELPAVTTGDQCSAEVALDYYQADTTAEVTAYIENRECVPADGEVHLKLRVTRDSGEVETLKVEQTWSQAQAGEVEKRISVALGQGATLERVRTTTLTCRCQPAAEPAR